MKKIFLPLVLLLSLSLLTACKKDLFLPSLDSSKPTSEQKVNLWLEQQKTNIETGKKDNIDLLKKNILFSNISIETNSYGQFIIFPISEAYKIARKISLNSSIFFVVLTDDQGSIQKGVIISFASSLNKDIQKLPRNTITNILGNNTPTVNGLYKFLSITGRFLYEYEYSNNRLISYKSVNQQSSLKPNTRTTACIDWFIVTTYHWPDGTTSQTSEYFTSTCNGSDGCSDPDFESICPDTGGGGGSTVGEILPNENIDAVNSICESSFHFNKYIEPSNGVGGWQVAGTSNIHMQIVDLETGQYVPLILPTIYFGLPVIRSNGDFYSEDDAKEIAAKAVEYAEQEVMDRYHLLGGSVNVVGLTLYYRQKMNERMQYLGAGSASLTSGSNITVTEIKQASYGWPIIGCL